MFSLVKKLLFEYVTEEEDS